MASTRTFILSAVLKFTGANAAAARLKKVKDQTEALRRSFHSVGRGVNMAAQGLRGLALVGTPVTLLMKKIIGDGINFEAAFARVKAVALDTSGSITKDLRTLAKVMGATTVYTATEAAQAMENLARAGLTMDEVAQSISPTLDAAAAEGMDLAAAASLVAANIMSFKLEAKDAAEVAGTMALVSARTNTNMIQLQEGMKFASQAAAPLTYNIKDVALGLGMLANLGMKGTLAGTALRRALLNIVRQAPKTVKALGGRAGFNEVVRDSTGKMRPMGEMLINVANKVRKLKDPLDKGRALMDIFGVRAGVVGNAFDLSGKDLKKFNDTQRELAAGAAHVTRTMRDIQLSTLKGQLTLLKSAIEGVNIEMSELITPTTKVGVKSLYILFADFALAMQKLGGANIKAFPKELQERIKNLSPAMINFTKGVRAAFIGLGNAFERVAAAFSRLGDQFAALPPETQQRIAKIAMATVAVLGVVLPLTTVFGIFAFMLKSGILLFAGLGQALLSVGALLLRLPLLVLGPLAPFAALFAVFADLGAIWEGVKQSFAGERFVEVKDAVIGLKNAFGDLLKVMFSTQNTQEAWREFGKFVGNVFGDILRVIAKVIEGYRQILILVRELKILMGDKDGKRTVSPMSSEQLARRRIQRGDLAGASKEERAAAVLQGNLNDVSSDIIKISGSTKEANTHFRNFVDSLGLAKVEADKAYRGMKIVRGEMPETLGSVTPRASDFGSLREYAAARQRIEERRRLAQDMVHATGGRLSAPGATPVAPANVTGRTKATSDIMASAKTNLTKASPGAVAQTVPGGGAVLRVEVPLKMDSREVARAVANVNLDDAQRRGRTLPAGEAARLISSAPSAVR